MPKLIITCGISGSGKSTYAAELVKQGWGEVNRDLWRFHLFCNGVEDWSLYKHTKDRENTVTEYCDNTFDGWVAAGCNIIVSNTHLTSGGNSKNSRDISYYENKAKEIGYDFEVKYFPITLEEAYKRDLRRGGKAVGRDVLNRQWKQWLKITGARTYQADTSLPTTVVSDVDGTVAEMYNRSPYEWDKVDQDYPRLEIIKIIESYVKAGNHKLVFVSGRDGSCYDKTFQWLSKYISIPFKLYMREVGDMSKDTIVKENIVFNNLEPNYNIVAWFDDRPCIIRKLKSLNIPNILDVSSSFEEF